MSHGWAGAQCRLVPLEPDRHLDAILRWANDPELTQWLLMGDTPLTRAAEDKWFEKLTTDESRIVFAIESFAGEHLGNTGLHQIEYRNGTAVVGILIGDMRNWGRGYGTDALQTLTRYAFAVLGLRLLLADVMIGNERSDRMFRKVGYEECGVIPQRYWKRGAYRDSRQFCFLRDRLEDSRLAKSWGIEE